MPLRANLDKCLGPLAFHGVPLTLFDAGYGEALTQILALSLPGLTGPEGFLPPNVRLVANFFRAGPDGVVHGFTHPAVHAASRNATTARAFRSGMQMRGGGGPAPNALLLGGSIEDLGMAATSTSASSPPEPPRQQVLAVGFLDADAEFVPNLPKFLEAYDCVILGDGGLQYVNHVIEQVLGTG